MIFKFVSINYGVYFILYLYRYINLDDSNKKNLFYLFYPIYTIVKIYQYAVNIEHLPEIIFLT